MMPNVDETFDAHSGALAGWWRAKSAYSNEVLLDRPIGYWRLNEASGTTANGWFALKTEGTFTGGATLNVTGPLADGQKATLLDGTDDYVDLTAAAAAIQTPTKGSIECWFKTNNAGTLYLYGWNANKGVNLFLTAGNLNFKVNAVAAVTTTGTYHNNVYHHVVATWDGTNVVIYVDGASVKTGTAAATADFAAATPAIGRQGGTSANYYLGQIANVAVYNEVLAAGRVLAHYNAGIGTPSGTAASAVLTTPHYDLRAFTNANVTVPYTMNDLGYWNAANWNGQTMTQMNTGTVITKQNETWTGTGLTVGRNASWRYQNYASTSVTVGVEKTFESNITDNITNDFSAGGTTYYIEGVLRGFPAQGAACHLDLANSYVDFSSDAAYAAGRTDSIAFNSSLTSLVAGGDLSFRFAKTLLVNLDPTSVKHVRFRLNAAGAGSFTFQVQDIRLFPSTKTFDTIDIDTRQGALVRTVATDGIEWTTDAPPMYHKTTPTKNFVTWLKFNTGHAPVAATASNKLGLLARYNEANGEFIHIYLQHNQSESRLRIFENFQSVYSTTAGTNTLTDSTDYYLKVEVNGTKVQASIYKAAGIFPGALVYSTGLQTVSSVFRGYMGLWFQPYNYDFLLSGMTASMAQIATLESTVFNTVTPLMGVTLNPKSSADTNLMENVALIASGDANLTDSITIGNPIPSQRVARSGVSWYGGLESSTYLAVGDARTLRIKGDIFPNTQVRGTFRVVLRDPDGLVAYIRAIPDLTPNKWNTFDLFVNGNFVPGTYKLFIQQTGFYGDSFYIDNVQVLQPTILWEASVNGGAEWYTFGNAIGLPYSAINFPLKGNQLKMRASALDTTAWIQGYEIVPRYGYPGRT